MDSPANPRSNHLRACLPAQDFAQWQPNLQVVSMPLGQVLYEAGGAQTYVSAGGFC